MQKVAKWLMIPVLLTMTAVMGGLYITISKDFNWIAHILAVPIGFILLILFSLADSAAAALRRNIFKKKA